MKKYFWSGWSYGAFAAGLMSLSCAAESRLERFEIVSEQVNPAMPVTAVTAVGLALASSQSPQARLPKPDTLWVRVPENLQGSVTVRLTAIDGRYVAVWKSKANGGPQRWEEITLPTTPERSVERDAILKEYARNQLAYVVSVSESSGTSRSEAWLPVAGEEPGSAVELTTAVLLNSGGAELIFYKFPGDSTSKVCKPIEGQRARYFNTACELSLKQAQRLADSGDFLSIRRASGSEFLDPVQLTLR